MRADQITIRPLFVALRNLGFPAALLSTLDLLERDERMPEVWRSLTSKGFTLDDIAPLIRAILQIKDLADDPPKIATKLSSLEIAVKSSRMLAEFYRQDPTGTDERNCSPG